MARRHADHVLRIDHVLDGDVRWISQIQGIATTIIGDDRHAEDQAGALVVGHAVAIHRIKCKRLVVDTGDNDLRQDAPGLVTPLGQCHRQLVPRIDAIVLEADEIACRDHRAQPGGRDRRSVRRELSFRTGMEGWRRAITDLQYAPHYSAVG
ncbi:hypothetical protein D3C81_1187740 [compost metagenome]